MSRKRILIINGPNLNLLGKREADIYGNKSFEEYFSTLQEKYGEHLDVEYFQSNSEGAIVDKIHEANCDIVLNAGAYTHTSVAIRDALLGVKANFVEVHISNVYQRESFRHHSYLSDVAAGVIVGCGLKGYDLALEFLSN